MYLSLFTEESAQALSSADETASLSANAEQSLSTIQKWLTSGYNWFISYLPNLISGLIIFVVGWWLTKLLCKLLLKAMTKGKADPTVATFLHSIINLALKTIVIICVLSTVGFDVTTIITTLGAAAVTIGLALKDSLSNVASGTLIILNKKFKIGDYLETEGLKGVVKKIDMMYTTLCTYDNKEVLIPNSRLTSNNIVNYFVQEERRIDLIIPISYSEDIDKATPLVTDQCEIGNQQSNGEGRQQRQCQEHIVFSRVHQSEQHFLCMKTVRERKTLYRHGKKGAEQG